MEVGSLTWLFNCSAWKPSAAEFSSCLALLPFPQQQDVARFIKHEDQKCALVSRLMQHMLIHLVLNVAYKDVVILRTREGKPYVGNCFTNPCYPNLNFSVSHHGDFVALASKPLCLVGLDIMGADAKEQQDSEEYIKHFRSCFTRSEWSNILCVGPDPRLLLHQFSRYWCLKESYIKAVGIGLGFELQRAEFYFEDDNVWDDVAFLRLDGVERSDWCFNFFCLDNNHWACIARGPLADAVDSFRETLHLSDLDEQTMADALKEHINPFTLLTIHDIIPFQTLQNPLGNNL